MYYYNKSQIQRMKIAKKEFKSETVTTSEPEAFIKQIVA